MAASHSGSSEGDEDSSPQTIDVLSLLGVKGPLRFAHHGCTQKAHIILRRVISSVDSDEDESPPRVARFSFYAQKRIEVKPGKEILLAIATDNDDFSETPLVFEADLLGEDDLASTKKQRDGGGNNQGAEFDLPEDTVSVVPPKMRRGWAKRPDDAPIIPKAWGTDKVSVGVQATPSTFSTCVQAAPSYLSASVQSKSSSTEASIQTDEIKLAPTVTEIETVSQVVEALLPILGSSSDSDSGEEMEISDCEEEDESLTPMELESNSSSASTSPTSSQPISVANSSQTSVLERSTSPVSQGDEMQKLLPAGAKLMELDQVDPPVEDVSTSVFSFIRPKFPITDVVKDDGMEEATLPASSEPSPSEQLCLPLTPETVKSPSDKVEQKACLNPKNGLSKANSIMDIFVPAKLSTGPTDMLASIPQGISRLSPSPLEVETKVTTSSQASGIDTSVRELRRIPTPPTFVPERATARRRPNSILMYDKAIPTGPASTRMQVPTHALQQTNAVASSSKLNRPPPTGPKAMLATNSSDLLHNPLGIRPSTMPTAFRNVLSDRPPPTEPKALSMSNAKKPVVVGSSWSATRANNPSSTQPSSAPNTAPTPVSPLSAKGPTSKPQLSSLLKYESPEPVPPSLAPPDQPPPPSILSIGSKWKPVNAIDSWSNGDPGRSHSPLNHSVALSIQPSSPVISLATTNHGDSTQSRHETRSLSQSSPSTRTSSQDTAVEPEERESISAYSKGARSPPSAEPITAFTNGFEGTVTVKRIEGTDRALSPNPLHFKTIPMPASELPIPTSHPLPARPRQQSGGAPKRGLKRERPQSPDFFERSRDRSPDRDRYRRKTKWPVIRSNHTKELQGDGEPNAHRIDMSSDGNYFVLSCSDRTVRVWNNRIRAEIARLSHNAPIVNSFWLADDVGVVTLTDDGLVHRWSRIADNQWKWSMLLDAGNDYRSEQDPICFAYTRERIAVSFPRMGVKVWTWNRVLSMWQAQRSILRQNVTAIKFVPDGSALMGGTRDGALWYCEIPNGTLRAYAFLKSKIISLDMSPQGTHVLVGQSGSSAVLVGIRTTENKGHAEQMYSCKDPDVWTGAEFGTVFATMGQAILLGVVESSVLVWDRKKGTIVYGLQHDDDDYIEAVATTDGAAGKEGCMITTTRKGQLCWWALPVAAQTADDSQKKRLKQSI
ncbi:hypothetical protein FA15DRAFT_668142 [Coprinopsis marcescibilis]|uniref:WD40 repeat-like protein n=1 Tax=Coprinopsis marcescibilis TaxID=230819 RepID=A0A5C3KZH6_COPMA|nr:hypothetical protein FA15DRAFT_668142 [Coprinopsis marcescibilis]